MLYVSLDNADTVIEGGPPSACRMYYPFLTLGSLLPTCKPSDYCGFLWHKKDPSVPLGGFPTRALFYQPRFGVAYDLFGKGNTVLEVIHAFERATGVKVNYEIGPRRAGDVEQVWGDVTKSTNKLGWKAERGIDTMMSSAWEWEKYISQNPL